MFVDIYKGLWNIVTYLGEYVFRGRNRNDKKGTGARKATDS